MYRTQSEISSSCRLKIAFGPASKATFIGPTGEKMEALKDVNLEIEDEFAPDGRDIGEFRVLLGPS